MVNIIHISTILFGLLAYIFSDVNSNSSFTNTFLPFIVMLCFIYGLIVTINMLNNMRSKSSNDNKSTDFLLASMKELSDKKPEVDTTNLKDTDKQ